MSNLVLETPYVIDLGNGFSKRAFQKDTIVTEPSIIADAPDFFSTGLEQDVLKTQDGIGYFIGTDVLSSGLNGESALGDEDIERYDSIEFKKMLLGFIAKDFKRNVVIPHLVTGLPVNHFKQKVNDIKQIIKGKHIVSVNEDQIIIEIKNVHVLPQPMGTYMYLVQQNSIHPNEELTLIVDGGHGSLDVTEMRGNTIVRRAGAEIGVRSAYVEIMRLLIDEYGENRSLTLSNMPQVMKEGFRIGKSIISVLDNENVQQLLTKHFDRIFKFIRENQFDLKAYNNVVFTGGMALLHQKLIEAKQRDNFIIVENAQEANAKGYFDFGEAVMEREKSSTLHQ